MLLRSGSNITDLYLPKYPPPPQKRTSEGICQLPGSIALIDLYMQKKCHLIHHAAILNHVRSSRLENGPACRNSIKNRRVAEKVCII